MANFDNLPDSRQSLLGYDHEGDEVWLIRGISQKQYTCPGCYGDVEIGEDHVIAQTVNDIAHVLTGRMEIRKKETKGLAGILGKLGKKK